MLKNDCYQVSKEYKYIQYYDANKNHFSVSLYISLKEKINTTKSEYSFKSKLIR